MHSKANQALTHFQPSGVCGAFEYRNLEERRGCKETDSVFCQSLALSIFRGGADGYSCPTESACSNVFTIDSTVALIYYFNMLDFLVEMIATMISVIDLSGMLGKRLHILPVAMPVLREF